MDVRQFEDIATEETRGRALGLLQKGLTPGLIQQHIGSEEKLAYLCRRYGVAAGDVVWLARRWPVRISQRRRTEIRELHLEVAA